MDSWARSGSLVASQTARPADSHARQGRARLGARRSDPPNEPKSPPMDIRPTNRTDVLLWPMSTGHPHREPTSQHRAAAGPHATLGSPRSRATCAHACEQPNRNILRSAEATDHYILCFGLDCRRPTAYRLRVAPSDASAPPGMPTGPIPPVRQPRDTHQSLGSRSDVAATATGAPTNRAERGG